LVRLALALSLLLVWTAVSFSQDPAAESRRHLVRGIAAVEIAQSEADLTLAADEFRKATLIAPNFAPAWINLGKVQAQLGQYGGAINSYRRYIALAPTADDATAVADEIIKLEFRQEQALKVKSRAGIWVAGDGTSYRLVIDGNRMTLSTKDHRVTDAEAVSTYPIAGKVPITVPVAVRYDLEMQGTRVSGTWSRAAFSADKCLVPEDKGEVAGEIRDADRTMTLRYSRTKYHASTLMGLLTDDFCKEVVAVETKEIERTFFGPLPKGGIGAVLGGIHSYWPGGISTITFGWSGHLVIDVIKAGSPASAAGLREGDEIVAIDDAAVKSLSASDAISRLRGEPGTEVALSIMRDKEGRPLLVRVKRGAISDDRLGWH